MCFAYTLLFVGFICRYRVIINLFPLHPKGAKPQSEIFCNCLQIVSDIAISYSINRQSYIVLYLLLFRGFYCFVSLPYRAKINHFFVPISIGEIFH